MHRIIIAIIALICVFTAANTVQARHFRHSTQYSPAKGVHHIRTDFISDVSASRKARYHQRRSFRRYAHSRHGGHRVRFAHAVPAAVPQAMDHDGRWGAFSDVREPERAGGHQRIHSASLGDGEAIGGFSSRGSERVGGSEIVAHPAGCPRRLFCGCGVAVKLLGAPIRSLWLAANWLRFPRAAPGPGMAAARRGHVFAILQNLGGGRVLAYDPNSGRGLTRVHVRSLAGYQVVNPRG